MARLRSTLGRFSGKIGEDVFVDSSRYGHHTRKAVEAGSKKDEPALKQQYQRTRLLNQLASQVNTAIRNNSDNFKSARFYELVQSRLRREPANKRCLLLQRLKGMEVHEKNPMKGLNDINLGVKVVRNKVLINLRVDIHPHPTVGEADCYYYELLLLTWNKTKKPPIANNVATEWIGIDGKKPEFEFSFSKRTGATTWMVCLYRKLGVKEKEIESRKAQGMQIVQVGSFDAREAKLMKKADEERRGTGDKVQGTRHKARGKKREVERVKAKVWR